MKSLTIIQGRIPQPEPGSIVYRDGFAVLTMQGAELPAGFPDQILREKVFKGSGSVTAFLCGGGRYFGKLYKYRGIFHSLKRTFRTPRAFRCFAGALLLKEQGFDTPCPLAAAVRYRGKMPVEQFLFTEVLPENTLYAHNAIRQRAPEEAGQFLAQAAGFLAGLHGKGFFHGDMSLRNFYCLPEKNTFGLIDLDGLLYFPGGVPRQVAAMELARLISSAYRCCENQPVPREEWLQKALQSYQAAGGTDLQAQEISGPLYRFLKHRAPVVWKG